MSDNDGKTYDVLIVGAGIAGAILAKQLGLAKKRVLVLEAGPPVAPNRNRYLETFYLAAAKTPESPYPPTALQPGKEATPRPTILGLNDWKEPAKSYLVQPGAPGNPRPENAGTSARGVPFASTYERVGGGTTWHWLGTSLRLVPDDLRMKSAYDPQCGGPDADWQDWPIRYEELSELYGAAEHEIGVAASVVQQEPLEEAIGLTYPKGYQYPMQAVPESLVDRAVSDGVAGMSVEGQSVFVTPTPQGRNSQPRANRRTCAGNTNCIPICPIEAKYDATVTLNSALQTGYVDVQYQTVVTRVTVDEAGRISGVEYLRWQNETDPEGTPGSVRATLYVLAAHAIETPKILLNSATEAGSLAHGVANSSELVGRNLMDHVIFLSWALMPSGKAVWPYRGPLSTSGIESLRNGSFRSRRAAFRIEIGNEGWNWAIGDPWTTVNDFLLGTNNSKTNSSNVKMGGLALAQQLNELLTRQFRLGFLIEQTPMTSNRVTLDKDLTDGLGIPRPKIEYSLDEYTLNGFVEARGLGTEIYQRMQAEEFTDYSGQEDQPGYFEIDGVPYRYFGAGHVVGTCRMGSDPACSVVDAAQRSHDHENLWLVGSSTFPTVATANPTLTIAALCFKTAENILSALGG